MKWVLNGSNPQQGAQVLPLSITYRPSPDARAVASVMFQEELSARSPYVWGEIKGTCADIRTIIYINWQ